MIEKKFIRINSKYLISQVNDILEKKNKNLKDIRIAISFNKNGNIHGILSLGDLRRNIVSNSQKPVNLVINKKPIILKIYENFDSQLQSNIIKKIYTKKINDIILISKKKKIHKILNFEEFFSNINYCNLSVIGAGHIGLPLSIFLLKKIQNVTLYDKNIKVLNDIKKNNLSFYERGLPSLLRKSLKDNRLNLTNDLNSLNSNIYIICIGTDLKNDKINNQNLILLLKKISKKIYKNCTILIRGTLQVGFSENIAIKILEKGSNLKCGTDFFYGYIPERLIEGDAINELNTIPQLISGHTQNCLKRVENICNFFFPKVIKLNSCAEGEIIKLSTNAVRDLNFAFANEITRISNIYNLSGYDLIQKANQDYPRNNIAKPSMGVGGFCLPKDPLLFKDLIKKNSGYQLSISREINKFATIENVKKILNMKKKYFGKKNIKLLIMGVAFKGIPETIDIRNSISLEVGNLLKKDKSINLSYFDTLGSEIKKTHKIKNIVNLKKINKFDMILLINNNTKYRDIIYSSNENIRKKTKIIYDFTNMIDENFCTSLGYIYKKL